MSRGTIAIPLLPHTSGYQPSLPQHMAPHDSIVEGLNVIYNPLTGGTLSVRPGYVELTTGAFSALPVTGIYSCTKSNGSTQLIAADTTKWWSFNSAFAATDITGGVNNTGTATDPWRFAFFPQGALDYIVGTNNVDAVRRWEIGAAAYTTPAAFPKCKDILVLGNRAVALNVIDGGTRYIYGVKWSASNDVTTWPGSALALLDGDDPIICGRVINRESALIYRANSIWKMTAQAGGDATAFRFDLLERVSGPVNGPSLTTVNGVDYYVCQDGWARLFDGNRTQIISEQIATNVPYFVDASTTPYVSSVQHAVYHNGTSAVWWTMIDGTYAFPYVVRRQQWECQQRFALSFSASHFGYQTSAAPSLPLTIFGGTGRLYWLSSSATTDNGTTIAWNFRTPKVCPDPKATYVVDELEDYFNQGGTGTVTVAVYGFDQPYQTDSSKTTLASGTYNLATGGPRFTLTPVPNLSACDRRRYLQVKYNGSGSLPYWSGGYLYVYPEAG